MNELFDFAVYRVLTHDGVVFLQLHTVWRIFTVFLRDVARRAWQAAVFVLRAFQNNLDAVASTFLCHDAIFYFSIPKASEKGKC